MSITAHKRTLPSILIVIGTLCAAGSLFAQTQTPTQPQPLPRLQQVPQTPATQNPAETAANSSVIPLHRTTPEALEQALRQICGHRFIVEGQFRYVFSYEQNNVRRQCVLRVEPQARQATLSGDKQLGEQVFKLVAVIDQPQQQQGKGRHIVAYRHAKPAVLAQAFDYYRLPPARPEQPRAGQWQTAATQNSEFSNPANAVRLVQFQDGGFDAGGIVNPVMQLPGVPLAGDIAALELYRDFRYDILTQLDALIIEADGAQIGRFKDMIRQIEELSKIAEPKIEVIYLKHVNNASLGFLFTQEGGVIYREIFGMTPGNVRIVPMVSPNAMLLIGWGPALEMAKDVVAALDQPTAVENSRLHIFKLKHISAQQARAVVAGTFPPPPALSGFRTRVDLFHEARSNVLVVQAAPNDLEEVKRIIAGIDVPAAGPTLRVERFTPKHTLAPDLKTTLDSALTAGTTDGKFPALELHIRNEEGQRLIASGIMADVVITADVRANMLIVRAPEGCMEFIKELIALLDASSPVAEIKVFQIIHGSADSMVTTLRTLFSQSNQNIMAGTPGAQLPRAAGEDALIPLTFAVDARTNCIVAAGAPGDLKYIEALLYNLDREDQQTRKEQVYPLKSMKAADVATTVDAFISRRRQIQTASQGVMSNYQLLESEVIVVPHEEGNSLLISATPKYLDEIIALIKEIDKSPAQVLIKVLIAEVMLTDTSEWGAEFGFQDPLMLKRGSGMLFNSNPQSSLGDGERNSGTVGTQLLTNFRTDRVGQETGFSGVVFSASSDYINIMLRVLQEQNRLEILGSPKITALNNRPAVINVGQEIVLGIGGSINPQSGAIQMNTDPKREIGLALTVTPNISPEGTIVMTVLAKKSKLGHEQEGTMVAMSGDGSTVLRSPKIDVINVGTVISAANNQTVVLGGLITRDTQKTRRKVPVLGDIPVLGKPFRYEFDRVRKTELLIILTPQIITSPEDDEKIKQMEFSRMSWCLNNVVKTYGDFGAYSVVSETPYTGNAPIVMPPPVKMDNLRPLESPILTPPLPTPSLPKRE